MEKKKSAPCVCRCGVNLKKVGEGGAAILLLIHMWKSVTFPWLVAGESSQATWEKLEESFASWEKNGAFGERKEDLK